MLLTLLPLFGGCAQARTTKTVPKAADAWTKLKTLYDYDRTMPLNAKTLDVQSNALGSTRRMTIRGSRGETIPVTIVLPVGASAQKKVPGLVLLHGKGDELGQVLMIFMARSAAANGYASLIPEVVDHDAQGNHKITPFSGDAARLRKTFIESVQDVRRSLDLFSLQPEVDTKRIGLIGLSLGGIMGSVTTSVDLRIKTAIFVVAGADWPSILAGSQDPDAREYRARYARKSLAERRLENQTLEAIDPRNFVAHIAPRPILMINGTKDELIPKVAAQTLFNAAREPKKQIWLPYGHFLSAEIRPLMQQWIDRHLKGAAPAKPAENNGVSISARPRTAAPQLIPLARDFAGTVATSRVGRAVKAPIRLFSSKTSVTPPAKRTTTPKTRRLRVQTKAKLAA